MLKAYPYFQAILDAENPTYEHNSMAENYCIVGAFYTQYIVNATSKNEPNKEAYEGLLTSFQTCMDNLDSYDYDDAAYIKLTMYREIANLLNEYRKGLAMTGVEKEQVLQLLESVYNKTDELFVTQPVSIQIKDSILNSYAEYQENIERVYTNTGERS